MIKASEACSDPDRHWHGSIGPGLRSSVAHTAAARALRRLNEAGLQGRQDKQARDGVRSARTAPSYDLRSGHQLCPVRGSGPLPSQVRFMRMVGEVCSTCSKLPSIHKVASPMGSADGPEGCFAQNAPLSGSTRAAVSARTQGRENPSPEIHAAPATVRSGSVIRTISRAARLVRGRESRISRDSTALQLCSAWAGPSLWLAGT